MPSVAARGVPCAAADIAVIDFIVIDTPHRNFDRASRDMIHKSPIVTDHYDRLPVIDQKIFQPLDGSISRWLVARPAKAHPVSSATVLPIRYAYANHR